VAGQICDIADVDFRHGLAEFSGLTLGARHHDRDDGFHIGAAVFVAMKFRHY